MKKYAFILLISILQISYTYSQTYEVFYEKEPAFPYDKIFIEPETKVKNTMYTYGATITTTFGDYSWSCNGLWLYFTVIEKVYYYNEGIRSYLFVAGPFGGKNSIVEVKYIADWRDVRTFIISPDNKKFATLFDDFVKILSYHEPITSFSELFKKSDFTWEFEYGYKNLLSRGFNWSKNSDIFYPSFYRLDSRFNLGKFYSVELNKVISIEDSPFSNDKNYEEIMVELCQKHNSTLTKRKNYYDCNDFLRYRNLKGIPSFTDEYLYIKIDQPKIKLRGDKKGVYIYYNNPMNNKIYRYSKLNAIWEKTNYFPDELPCSYHAKVKFEPITDVSIAGGVKGDWGQTIENTESKTTYKLVFKKY